MSEEEKKKIIDFLKAFAETTEKGVATMAEIAKGTGIDRKAVSKLLVDLEMEGKVVGAGRAAGVMGYKLKA